jgi:hypothetical protein
MAAPPARARADYDYLIKLLLIGDSGELAATSQPLPLLSYLDLREICFVRGHVVMSRFCVIWRSNWDPAPRSVSAYWLRKM